MKTLVEWVRVRGELRMRRRVERARQRQAARVERARRRRELAARIVATARALRPVAPVAMVTGFAVFGQIGYGLDHYTPAGTPWVVRLIVAVGAAVTVESIANYVQWHAHDALLNGATGTAARLRRASYLIALGVAAVNYSHFSDGLAPTPGAVVFGLFSGAQPWLWGLHTRRALQLQLKREGKVDVTGAVFSAERWRAFPYRTWLARRYSIANGITDPRAAWEGSEAERLLRQADRAHARASRRASRHASRGVSSRVGLRTYWRSLLRAGRTDPRTDGCSERPEGRTDSRSVGEARTVPTVQPVPVARTEEPRTEPVPVARTDQDADARTDTRPVPTSRTDRDAPAERDTDRPVPSRPRRLTVVDDAERLERVRQLAAELGETPSAYRVRQVLGCRQSVAERLLRLLDETQPEREAVAVG